MNRRGLQNINRVTQAGSFNCHFVEQVLSVVNNDELITLILVDLDAKARSFYTALRVIYPVFFFFFILE
jgi:hypothetical protein